jgi:hypothetical protein
MVRPFVGLIFGSGDDDPGDDDLGGFFTLPAQGEITLLTGTSFFGHLDPSPSIGEWGPASPARAIAGGQPGDLGNTFRHTTGSPFSDRIGNTTHPGIVSTHSNPGTFLIPVGVKVAPLKGHEVIPYYMYVGLTDVSVLRAALGPGTGHIHTNLYHELGVVYSWQLNPHFDFRLSGQILIPSDGVKDIANTVDCSGAAGFQRCEGEDIALRGEIRFRGQF